MELQEQEKKIYKRHKRKGFNKNITVASLLRLYFDANYTNNNTITQNGYHAEPFVQAFGNRHARCIDREDIENFILAQKIRGCTQITINRRIAIFRTALAWAVKTGILETNPLQTLTLQRSKTKEITPPTVNELKKILNVATNQVARTIILGINTGARIGPSELFRLEWDDVDLANKIIRMPCAEKNKKLKTRIIPINKTLHKYLVDWKKEDEDIMHCPYVVHFKGKKIRSIHKAWTTTLKNAGITRTIRPYDLRHAYATLSIANGADIKTVAEIMGHTDSTMILKVYQHVLFEQKEKAMNVISKLM